jgi:hypothetical protein
MRTTSNPAATDFIRKLYTAVTTAHKYIIRTNECTSIQANRRRQQSVFAVGDLVLLVVLEPACAAKGKETVCKSKVNNARSLSQRTDDRTGRAERKLGAEDSETSLEE